MSEAGMTMAGHIHIVLDVELVLSGIGTRRKVNNRRNRKVGLGRVSRDELNW